MLITPLILAAVIGQTKPPVAPVQDYTGPRKRAAVLPVDILVQGLRQFVPTPSGSPSESIITIDEPADFGTGVGEMLITALVDSKRFILLERTALKDVEDEIARQKTENFANDSAVAAGKQLGAQVLIKASVTELSFKKNQAGGNGGIGGDIISAGSAAFVATAAIDVRIIDVSTGQILDSVKAEGKAGNKTSFVGFTAQQFAIGGSTFESSPVAKALRAAVQDAVKKISTRLDRMPWEARIASISGETIYLNFGKDANIAAGTALEVFRPGLTIVDPQTKEILGREDDKVLGTCTVRTVNPKFSVALLSPGFQPVVGDGVRLIKSPSMR